MGNFVQVIIPHKRHARMTVTESWTGTHIRPTTRSYDVCKYCYVKMKQKRPRWKTVVDFGDGIEADEVLEEL